MMKLLPSQKGLSARSQLILFSVAAAHQTTANISIASTKLAELHCSARALTAPPRRLNQPELVQPLRF